MRNLNMICIEKDFVAWSSPNETLNISASRENQSNAIPGQIQEVIDGSLVDPALMKYRAEYFLN